MADDPTRPMAPEVPDYVLDALEARDPDELREVATYASELADFLEYQQEREAETHREEAGLDTDEQDQFEEQGYSDDPEDYDDVPASGAYITIKEPKSGNRYSYWQWRSGSDSWKNKYIGPVEGK